MSVWAVGAGESVQAAVALAADGDRIEIAAGSYQEGLDLAGKSLTLVGAGSAGTVIGGTGVATCLDTGGGDVTVEGLSFAACDVLLVADGGTLAFTDVELWGGLDGGTATGVTWAWMGGGLDYLDGSGLAVDASDLAWDGVTLTGSETDDTVLALTDTTATLADLVAEDDVVGGWGQSVVALDGGALALPTCAFAGNDSTGGTVRLSDGSLTTEACTFTLHEGVSVDVAAGSWDSADDRFVGDARAVGLSTAYGAAVSLARPTFSRFEGGTFAYLRDGEATDVVSDGGTFWVGTAVVDGCALESAGVALESSGAEVHGCTIVGTGDTAVQGSVTLVDSTVSGFTTVFVGGDVTAEGCTFSDVGSILDEDRRVLTLTDVDATTTGTAIVGGQLTLTLSDVRIAAATRGLRYGGTATLDGVEITAHDDAVEVSEGSLVATSSSFTTTGDAAAVLVAPSADEAVEIELTGGTVTSAGDGIASDAQPEADVTLDGVTVDAAADGIRLTDGRVTLASSTVGAGGDGIVTAGGAFLDDTAIVAVGTAVDAASIFVDGVTVESGGDGLVADHVLEAEDTEVAPGGGCLVATERMVLVGVVCTGGAGDRPVDAAGQATWSDVLVEGFASTSPSRIADATGSLSRVRFVGNSAEEGAGALTISRASVTAEGLYFEGNRGTTTGALWATDSTLAVTGAVFRGNTPDDVLEAAGGDWQCTVSDSGFEVAEESTSLRNVTLTGGLVLSGAFAEVDSSIVTSAGEAVSGAAGTRLALFVYNDVWGSPPFADGLTDYTGQNGNLSADPLLDAELRLGAGSPCIDAGNPAYPDDDGTPPDMGARAATCPELDFDGDGQLPSEGDCDDTSRGVHAGADEVPCDGLDNDCAGDGDDPDCGGDTGAAADDTGAPGDTDDVEESEGGYRGSRCGCAGGDKGAILLVLGLWGRGRRRQTP